MQILACTTDNASNNDTFMEHLEKICHNAGITFDAENQRVRCIAHILNLAVQEALKTLKADQAANEDELLDIEIDMNEVIPKV